MARQASYSLRGREGSTSAIEKYLTGRGATALSVPKLGGAELTSNDYAYFANAWEAVATRDYGYKGNEKTLIATRARPRVAMREENEASKIFESYFKQNIKEGLVNKPETLESFSSSPFGQIVVDEVNKAIANIPEIRLALDVLEEQEEADPELQAQVLQYGKEKAVEVLNKVREKLTSDIETTIEQVMNEMELN